MIEVRGTPHETSEHPMSAAEKQSPARTVKLTVQIEVDEQRLGDLLCCGMEGGINYWAAVAGYVKPAALTFRTDPEHVYRHIDYPMNKGGAVIIQVEDEYAVDGKTRFKLTRAKLLKGLVAMQRECPNQFSNWLRENDDAATGDCLIQCALFGKLIFG
jgi:hypothetical protein